MITRPSVGPLRRVVRKVGTELARHSTAVAFVWPEELQMVSISFDDFPVSAAGIGAKVVEGFGARATYYGSLGIAHSESASGPIAGGEVARELAVKGHEIGCHTFRHLDCTLVSSDRMAQDCRANHTAAENLLGERLTSFAYPYGAISIRAKRVAQEFYETARTVWPGVNSGVIDLMALRSVPLPQDLDRSRAVAMIRRVSQVGGWLVFHTHDVADKPSPYGCTPSTLGRVLDQCRSLGIPVMPVRQAVGVAKERVGPERAA